MFDGVILSLFQCNILLYEQTTMYTYIDFTVDRHLCHFQFWVIVSNGARNIFVPVFWGNKHSFLLGTGLGVIE